MSVEPLFTVKGGYFLPTAHTRGPWDPRHQHGGAVAALIARAVERTAGDEFVITRLTVELMRPVPLDPLVLDISVPRPGRRVLGIGVSVSAGDLEVEVARAHAVAIRRIDLPVGAANDERLVPGPEEVDESVFIGVDEGVSAFHHSGMEIRFVDGADTAGPARAWFRLRRPVVEDEQPSGVQRAAAAADFGNGISSVLPFDRWIYLNPDLTLHLSRPPVGEWIGLDAITLPSDLGMAMAESTVFDTAGRVGRAAQSLLVDRRP